MDTFDEAIALVNASAYGNMACLFTTSGAAARQFRYEVQAGNVGINVGMAAPMASSRPPGGGTASSATCTRRAATPSSSSPRRRLSWSAGRATWSRKF